jgi:hypothetical protein
LLIGLGKADFKNLPLYEDLQKFGWIVIPRQNGYDNNVELTFSGKHLFNRHHTKWLLSKNSKSVDLNKSI